MAVADDGPRSTAFLYAKTIWTKKDRVKQEEDRGASRERVRKQTVSRETQTS